MSNFHAADYLSSLPYELRRWYRRLDSCGHSILSISPHAVHLFPNAAITGLLIPCPVKTVLRGYSIRDGYVWLNPETHCYDKELGLVVDDEDEELDTECYLNYLRIVNDGAEILETNYFQLTTCKFFLSVNARSYRLLIPEMIESSINEMKSCEYAIISYADNAYEILFEDHTDNPYQMQSDIRATDRIPLKSEMPCSENLILSVWISPARKVLELPARIRRVKSLPYCRPWGK
jgi:hypothetical protein